MMTLMLLAAFAGAGDEPTITLTVDVANI